MGESLSPVCRRRKLATTSSHHQVKAATERPLAVALHFRKRPTEAVAPAPPLAPRLGGWKTEAVGCWPVCRRFLPRVRRSTLNRAHIQWKGVKIFFPLARLLHLLLPPPLTPRRHTLLGLLAKTRQKIDWLLIPTTVWQTFPLKFQQINRITVSGHWISFPELNQMAKTRQRGLLKII